MAEEELEQVFFGQGKGMGKLHTTGKGKGRKRNPIGADGQVMKCSICGSDVHFRGECPRNSTGGSTAFSSYIDMGPTSDLAFVTIGPPWGPAVWALPTDERTIASHISSLPAGHSRLRARRCQQHIMERPVFHFVGCPCAVGSAYIAWPSPTTIGTGHLPDGR